MVRVCSRIDRDQSNRITLLNQCHRTIVVRSVYQEDLKVNSSQVLRSLWDFLWGTEVDQLRGGQICRNLAHVVYKVLTAAYQAIICIDKPSVTSTQTTNHLIWNKVGIFGQIQHNLLEMLMLHEINCNKRLLHSVWVCLRRKKPVLCSFRQVLRLLMITRRPVWSSCQEYPIK